MVTLEKHYHECHPGRNPEEQVDEEEEEDICSICLDVLNNGQELRKLGGCGHQFHKECIKDWFRQNRVCPLCMREVERSQFQSSGS